MSRVEDCGKKIVEKLQKAGHIAYWAGGWVRDLLLEIPSDEIDIATSASPECVADLFTKTVSVGAAFGVMIVIEEGLQFEVATFRKDKEYLDGRHPEGVEFSSPEEDAKRRDFTINGMFFDPISATLLDYVGGQEDLNRRLIKAIGEPKERFHEDRLRMLRAVRFANRFDFEIESKTATAIEAESGTLFPAVSVERVWQELDKMAKVGSFSKAVLMLHKLHLLGEIFPDLNNLDQGTLEARMQTWNQKRTTVLYLMDLFPDRSTKEQVDLCKQFHLSNEEIKLLEFAHMAKELFSKKAQEYEFAKFYADSRSNLIDSFIGRGHKERRKRLETHIQRIRDKRPLVSSQALVEEGISPGPLMGSLLREAERMSVNLDVHSSTEVLEKLKASPLWPQ